MNAAPAPTQLRPRCGLQVGKHLIRDVMNPKVEEIDLEGIEYRLAIAHRFSNSPEALTVLQHSALVAHLAAIHDAPFEVRRWCLYHDYHEGVIGDIPGPLKNLLRTHTDALDVIERRLDLAICEALGFPFPGEAVRKEVHKFDKMAEALEWRAVLGHPEASWHYPLTQQNLLDWSKIALSYKLGFD